MKVQPQKLACPKLLAWRHAPARTCLWPRVNTNQRPRARVRITVGQRGLERVCRRSFKQPSCTGQGVFSAAALTVQCNTLVEERHSESVPTCLLVAQTDVVKRDGMRPSSGEAHRVQQQRDVMVGHLHLVETPPTVCRSHRRQPWVSKAKG